MEEEIFLHSVHPHSAGLMREWMHGTETEGFLSVQFHPLWDSKECQIALGGIDVRPEGVLFTQIDRLVTNEEIAVALHIRQQRLGFVAPLPGTLSRGELENLEIHVKNVDSRIKFSEFRNKGFKLWVIKMYERMFIKRHPSSITNGNLWIIDQVRQYKGHLLAWWKVGLSRATSDDRTVRELNSGYNLVLGYLLKHSSSYTGLQKFKEELKKVKKSRAMDDGLRAHKPSTASIKERNAIEECMEKIENMLFAKQQELVCVQHAKDELKSQLENALEQRDLEVALKQAEITRAEDAEHKLFRVTEERTYLNNWKAKACSRIEELQNCEEQSKRVPELESQVANFRQELLQKDRELVCVRRENGRFKSELENTIQLRDLEVSLKQAAIARAKDAERDLLRLTEERKNSISWKAEAVSQIEELRRMGKHQSKSKKRKAESAALPQIIADDADGKIVEEVYQKVKREYKELEELRKYRDYMKTALVDCMFVPWEVGPDGIGAEGFYQWIAVLVDLYRVAMGFNERTLTDSEWISFMEELPLQVLGVIPRMLWEDRLRALNPEVCNYLARGLINLHVSHLITSQQWIMSRKSRPQKELVTLSGEVISAEFVYQLPHRLQDQAANIQERVEEHMVYQQRAMERFLKQVDEHESTHADQPGARRIRWALHCVGWQKEIPKISLLSEQQVPPWMVNYSVPAPKNFAEGVFAPIEACSQERYH